MNLSMGASKSGIAHTRLANAETGEAQCRCGWKSLVAGPVLPDLAWRHHIADIKAKTAAA